MAGSFDLTNIKAKLGDYARDPDVKTDLLYGMMYNPAIENRIEVITGAMDEIPIPNVLINDPLAPLKNVTNVIYKENVVDPDAEILKTKDCILAIKIYPTELWATYLGTLERENYKRKKAGEQPWSIPFEEFLMQKIKEKAMSSLYALALFQGVRDEDGTTSSSLFDGFLKKISDAITASVLAPVITGAFTDANVHQKAWMLVDALGEASKNETVHVHMPGRIFDWLARTYTPVNNGNIVVTDTEANRIQGHRNTLPIQGTNAIAFREPGMGATNRVICTEPKNLFLGFNNDPNSIQFEIQKEDLALKVLMYFKAGTAIGKVKDEFEALTVSDIPGDDVGGGEGE